MFSFSPSAIANLIEYSSTPPDEEWRSGFLLELLELGMHNLELCWEDDVGLSLDELDDLIRFVATT